MLVSDYEVEQLTADGGADGREHLLGAAEVVSDEAGDAGQDGLLVTTLPQLFDDPGTDA